LIPESGSIEMKMTTSSAVKINYIINWLESNHNTLHIETPQLIPKIRETRRETPNWKNMNSFHPST